MNFNFLKTAKFWLAVVSILCVGYLIVFLIGIFAVIKFDGSFRAEDRVEINSTIYKNLAAAGKRINVNEAIEKDIFFISEFGEINAPVKGKVVFLGSDLDVNDEVKGDFYAAGEKIRINSDLNGKVRISGDEITIGDDAKINGDLRIGASTIYVNGELNERSRLSADQVYITGEVNSDITIIADKVVVEGTISDSLHVRADVLEIKDSATVNDLKYDVDDLNISKSAEVGAKDKQKIHDFTDDPIFEVKVNNGAKHLGRVIFHTLAAVVLFFFFKDFFKRCKDFIWTQPVRAIKYGILFQILAVGTIIVSIVTIIGIPVGLFVLLCYILIWTFANSMSSVIIAIFLNEKLKVEKYNIPEYAVLIATAITFSLFTSLSIIEGFVTFILGIFLMGALFYELQIKTKN